MRRVLIVADLGHASPRIPGLSQFLPEHGWQATILTPRMSAEQRQMFVVDAKPAYDLVETPDFEMLYGSSARRSYLQRAFYRLLQVTGLQQFVYFPDRDRPWLQPALRAGKRELELRRYDAVMSSSSPATAHLIAERISRQHGLPWVADLRDLWARNHNYPYGKLRRWMDTSCEQRVLGLADRITTITPQLARTLQSCYGNKISEIPNGYYPFAQKGKRTEEKMVILYSGRIYPQKQNLEFFLKALDEEVSAGNIHSADVVFQYAGPSTDLVQQYSIRFPRLFDDTVRVLGNLSRARSHELQREADLLLLLNWEDPAEKGIATTKLYEYLGARKNIIAVGGFGGDYVQSVLERTSAGQYLQSAQQLRATLVQLYRNFKADQRLAYYGDEEQLMRYSYPSLAGQLAGILDLAREKSGRGL